ncbi:MAG: type II toxin-antitoxin system RelE/ParE family toxin [Sedimentisphaerales bacterium]
MPKTKILIYQDKDGSVPLLEWLDGLPPKARDKCLIKIELLEEFGYDLRRPHCDLLEQGIYELRARLGHINYRILYFFEGKNIVIASHGCMKEKEIPKSEINKAIRHRDNYIRSPKAHTYRGGL